MVRKVFLFALLLSALLLVSGCFHNKVENPIAHVDSKQPDKVLFDRGMDMIKHRKYDAGRLTLQTLLNTYPDSEFVARAKLAIADSWYAEGGPTGYAQAEIEYKDFITFFPNMPEAAEAQLKVANIHYKQMEKPDRDYTHAKRAEDEYKELLQQFPDSKLVPEAKQRLLEVQEVLAEREYRIGRFYYLREAFPAAIARLKSLTDTYPLFSNADDAYFMLGQSYEKQIDALRNDKNMKEAQKAGLIKLLTDDAAAAYTRIVQRYPIMDSAKSARERLKALHRPVPEPTPEAIALNKKEQESRGSTGMFGKMMGNLSSHPDVAKATKVGEPTLVEPPQTGAPEVARGEMTTLVTGGPPTTNSSVGIETTKGTGNPPPNQPPPNSNSANDANTLTPSTPDTTNSNQPNPLTSNTQVNEADPQNQNNTANKTDQTSGQKDDKKDDESSSKKKKKHGLRKIVPF